MRKTAFLFICKKRT